MPESNPVIKQTSFSPGGIRDIILKKKKEVKNIKGSSDDFVLITTSTDGSNFQNFVDIIDEVTVNNINHYYLDEITNADKKSFSKN